MIFIPKSEILHEKFKKLGLYKIRQNKCTKVIHPSFALLRAS